jgi:hypothetical protein
MKGRTQAFRVIPPQRAVPVDPFGEGISLHEKRVDAKEEDEDA